MARMQWTTEKLEQQLREISTQLGHFPSAADLREMKRGDIAAQLGKGIGFRGWSQKLGIAHVHSDSDTGWKGEIDFAEILGKRGHVVEHQSVKSPFDLLVDTILRVDVKSANYAEYGASRGWFYRIGKKPQADLILLYQLDTTEFVALPWHVCPHTNVTISRGGGKYAKFLNNWQVIDDMIRVRREEQRATARLSPDSGAYLTDASGLV